jgi:transcriptional regulator with AAA-type ATPase domain
MDFDDEEIPSFNGKVQVCCCQPCLPHDESIKFILKGDNEAVKTVLFENRPEG